MNKSGRAQLLIAGIAEGLGISIAKTFATAGYDVTGVARSNSVKNEALAIVDKVGSTYKHIACDLGDAGQVNTAFTNKPPYDIVIYNAHALLIESFEQTTPEKFEAVWRVGCFGAMQISKIALPDMEAANKGTLIFTGATAGVRGGAKFAAFSSAKFALRGLAQALAREYSPKGVHVAHVILDGLIAEPQTTQRFGDSDDQRMEPDEIAKIYLDLANQKRSAWTHELDLRPFTEKF